MHTIKYYRKYLESISVKARTLTKVNLNKLLSCNDIKWYKNQQVTIDMLVQSNLTLRLKVCNDY